jgi:hypothetical protein
MIARIEYIYSDGPHPIGTVEQLADDRWRASTRHTPLGCFPDRDSAIEAVHATLDGGRR